MLSLHTSSSVRAPREIVRRFLPYMALMLIGCDAPAPGLAQADAVEMIFLDVGQGDAIVIRSPEGKIALIDAGPAGDIVGLLYRHGIDSIDIAIASHPHADHIGGMAAVIRSVPVRYYMDNGVPHTTATYRQLLRMVEAADLVYLDAVARTIELGSVVLTVWPPSRDGDVNLNNSSIGILVQFGRFKALLTGDSEVAELNHFISLGVPEVTVLKAAHHGSRDGVTPAWLSATKPEVVVISCGSSNPYGHPDPWALRYYEAIASEVYRTDRDGEVRMTALRDGSYEIKTEPAPIATGATGAAGSEREVETATGEPAAETSAAGPTFGLWVFADAPGNDHYNLNGEFVVLTNEGGEEVRIGGWTLCDAASHCFTFPSETVVGRGGRAVVYTGAGLSDGISFYMNSSHAVWNNSGDVAMLRDALGRVVATYAY